MPVLSSWRHAIRDVNLFNAALHGGGVLPCQSRQLHLHGCCSAFAFISELASAAMPGDVRVSLS